MFLLVDRRRKAGISNNVEMFHEGERILIIAGLPDVKLPDQIDVSARFKNGVLEVAIKK